MELSLERVADAVTALRNEDWNQPQHERRLLPRFRVWTPQIVHLVGGDTPGPLEVWLIDLAPGGVGLLSTQALPAGQEFTVALPGIESGPMHVLCRVAHCRPAANGSHPIGAQFVRELAVAATTAACGTP